MGTDTGTSNTGHTSELEETSNITLFLGLVFFGFGFDSVEDVAISKLEGNSSEIELCIWSFPAITLVEKRPRKDLIGASGGLEEPVSEYFVKRYI